MARMWTCATSPLNVGTHLSQTCTSPVPALSLCGCIASLLLGLFPDPQVITRGICCRHSLAMSVSRSLTLYTYCLSLGLRICSHLMMAEQGTDL